LIKVPASELSNRINSLKENLTALDPNWSVAAVMNKLNLFYFTGTQQNGVLFIPREGDALYFIRRSFERAQLESEFDNLIKFNSFRDVAEHVNFDCKDIYLEKEFVTLAHFERFNKYFGFENSKPLDFPISQTRAVKSEYELDLQKKSGEIHREVLEDIIPNYVKIGMSEAELSAHIMHQLMLKGHQGTARIAMYNTEMFLGNVCFGESSIHFNTFDGPGGIKGYSPAVPYFGSNEVKLEDNQLIFLDIGCGYHGYHTDKTVIYATGKLTDEAYKYHQMCVDIQNNCADLMVPGAIPSEIYEKIMTSLDEEFAKEFMGFGSGHVKFLGHGVGLVIDEYPVIAKGFDEPLKENIVMALEPKRGIKGVGMVGIENTFVITPEGAKSITGHGNDIIHIK